MIVFSALRRNIPIIGIRTSTDNAYVTLVLADGGRWYDPSIALSS